MNDAETASSALSLLQLMWLASPALPVGGFSYSEGLEAAIDSGRVQDEGAVAAWLVDQLWLGQARSELVVLAQAVRAWRANDRARAHALNDWVLHTRETAELRLQSLQMGRSLLEWLRQLPPMSPLPHTSADTQAHLQAHLQAMQSWPPTWPVAFGLAAAHTTASVRDCVLACAFGWAENMTQAAIKAVPLGQTAGQRILARLVEDIPAAVDEALQRTDAQRMAFAPLLAIVSAQHETQYSRLFRS
ncbi:MAG: hypothetical protein RLZZ612_1236 [Pseudomonadota bacterium]|jgi:urease accessory protein